MAAYHRFVHFDDENLKSFLSDKENERTKRKTKTNIELFQTFVEEKRAVKAEFYHLLADELNS